MTPIVLAWLMPWRAVRQLQESERDLETMCKVLLAQAKRLDQYEPRPKPRHLYLVK